MALLLERLYRLLFFSVALAVSGFCRSAAPDLFSVSQTAIYKTIISTGISTGYIQAILEQCP
jgi:hypothetical protein